MTDDDRDLTAQFEALKAEDARAVQPFATCWEAARLSSSAAARAAVGVRRRQRWLGVPAAAGALAFLLIAAIIVYIRPASHHIQPASRSAIGDISRWQSPTASLLKTPGSELLTDMPRVGEPVIPRVKDEIK